MEDSGLHIRWIGGQCPVQGDGTIDGFPFYFRARWDSWSFEVGEIGSDPPVAGNPWWRVERIYNEDPDAAGRMPEDEARVFMAQAAAAFREWRKNLR